MRKQIKQQVPTFSQFSEKQIKKPLLTQIKGGDDTPPPPIVHEDIIDH